MQRRGAFVSFEGGEGTGKSTQFILLGEYLTRIGKKVISVREPGGTSVSEALRDFIMANRNMENLTELLLYMASRAELFIKVVRPGLYSSDFVLADRCCDSTVAYQGYARNIPLKTVYNAIQIAVGTIQPDVTYLLDIAPEEGLKRSSQVETNRFEEEEISFHQKVREGFLAIARDNPSRIRIISADKSKEEVFQEVLFDLKARKLI